MLTDLWSVALAGGQFLVSLVLLFAWHRARRAYLSVERWGVSAENGGGIPTAVVEGDPFHELKIGDKHLFIRPLSVHHGRRFRRESVRWMIHWRQHMHAVSWLSLGDFSDPKAVQAALQTMAGLLQKKEYNRAMQRLLAHTLLKDPRCNPEGLSRRYMLRRMSDLEMAKTLHLLFAYNCGDFIKKNFESAIKAMLTLSPGMIATPYQPGWRKAATATDTGKPLYPDSPYMRELMQNSESDSGKSTKQERRNDETET